MAGLGFEPDLMPFTHRTRDADMSKECPPHATGTPHTGVLSDPGHYSHLAGPTYFATSWMSLGEDAWDEVIGISKESDRVLLWKEVVGTWEVGSPRAVSLSGLAAIYIL